MPRRKETESVPEKAEDPVDTHENMEAKWFKREIRMMEAEFVVYSTEIVGRVEKNLNPQ